MARRETDSANWGGRRPGAGSRKSTGITTQTVAVSLPIPLVEWLGKEAKARNLSKSRIVALALEKEKETCCES